ncbi:hypothetical protein Sjap_013827 [Stephania japonica]|uniref:Uncharacterized protein n=1 Tax=Stephania japonica TaxID=461633 RepID=A0AAP0P0C7_9MAGN
MKILLVLVTQALAFSAIASIICADEAEVPTTVPSDHERNVTDEVHVLKGKEGEHEDNKSKIVDVEHPLLEHARQNENNLVGIVKTNTDEHYDSDDDDPRDDSGGDEYDDKGDDNGEGNEGDDNEDSDGDDLGGDDDGDDVSYEQPITSP